MDVHLGVCHDGYVVRLDVTEGPSGRRQRSDEDKARIVAESLTAGVRVADVARRHGLTRWQVYDWRRRVRDGRSEEHTSELQSLMRISYAVFCLKKKKHT